MLGNIHVGIITIRPDEFQQVLGRFERLRRVEGRLSEYRYTDVRTKVQGKRAAVAIARCPEQGQNAAQATTTRMLADLDPDRVFLVGICGAFPDAEYTLGDVLLSTRLDDFSVNAMVEGVATYQDQGGGRRSKWRISLPTFLPQKRWPTGARSSSRSRRKSRPERLMIRVCTGKKPWREKVLRSLRHHFADDGTTRQARYFGGPIIAGNTLLKDTELAAAWRTTARQAIGVEMERGGAFQAARYSEGKTANVIAIRGVSDIVGYNRDPAWTAYACRAAAVFCSELIASGTLPVR